jgi:hypothetical protein
MVACLEGVWAYSTKANSFHLNDRLLMGSPAGNVGFVVTNFSLTGDAPPKGVF